MDTKFTYWPNLHLKAQKLSRPKALGWMALVVMVLASSTNPSLGKQLTTAFSPLSLILISEILAGTFAMMSFGLIPIFKEYLKIHRKQIAPLLIVGVTNGIIGPLMWFKGLHATTAVNAELFGRTEMIFLVSFSFIFLRERLLTKQVLAGFIVIFGIVVVAMKGFTEGMNLQLGDSIILISALSYSIGGIILKKYLHNLHPEIIIFQRTLMAILFFLVVSPFIEHPFFEEARSFPFALIPVLLGFGFISRFLSIFSFYLAIERLPVSTVSVIATLGIAGNAAFAYLYLGEYIHWYQYVGGILVIIGVLAMQFLGVHRTKKNHLLHIKQHHRHHL